MSQTSPKSTNPDEDKENADNDVYSLQEVIESEKERDEIASAVLGASDEQNCSYDQGYVYRQALFCCITCLKSNQENKDDIDKLHGICLACSYECHQNHELYELYTKREFKCDCGNSKFSKNGNKCKLQSNKDDLNTANKYNHNFNGLYCECNRPYPDTEASASSNPDDTVNNEEMIQCTVCEDWFHMKHLQGSEMFEINDENDYEEMICHLCMPKNQFLWYYQDQLALCNNKVDIETCQPDNEKDANVNDIVCVFEKLKLKNEQLVNEKFADQKLSCFLLDGWREALCKCKTCLKMYNGKNIDFLLKTNDTIKYYEDFGKLKDNSVKIDETKILNDELSKMNRVSQIEFLHNLNDFKSNLKDFLENFARNGQVVKRENIEEFFDDLKERKKRRLNNINSY